MFIYIVMDYNCDPLFIYKKSYVIFNFIIFIKYKN